MDINTTTLVGRIARGPEIKQSAQSGVTVARFTVAANHRYLTKDRQQKEQVAYVPCVLFGAPATWAQEHRKGEAVAVSGHLVTESWEKDGQKYWRLGLHVAEVQFFHRPNGTNGQVQEPAAMPEGQPPF